MERQKALDQILTSTDAPAQRGGLTNSTTVNNSSPPLSLLYSPIHQSDDSGRHKEHFVRDLSSDPSISKHMIDDALSKVSRLGYDHQWVRTGPLSPSHWPNSWWYAGIKLPGVSIKTTSHSSLMIVWLWTSRGQHLNHQVLPRLKQ